MTRRVVVIGGGPIGLAAAHSAVARGFDVTLLEAGEVGEALERWGPVRFFTPLRMNLPGSLRALLGDGVVSSEALLTGPEMRRRVLEPLAALLAPRVKIRHRVIAVGRRGMTRVDYPNHPLRSERPFVLQVATEQGDVTIESDFVLDASGGYSIPNPLGMGGLPARGERADDARIIRDHATLASRLPALAGRRILLVGHGHSAANALSMLESLATASPATWVTWAVRTANRRPCVAVPNDPLSERDRVVSRANDLASDPPEWLRVERRAMVEEVAHGDDGTTVTLTGNRSGQFDLIVSCTGFRPDSKHLSELAVELSPVTEGAARLTCAIANVTDCLSAPAVNAADLQSGEPGYFFIGARSYGRARTFLLQSGLLQLETVLELISR